MSTSWPGHVVEKSVLDKRETTRLQVRLEGAPEYLKDSSSGASERGHWVRGWGSRGRQGKDCADPWRSQSLDFSLEQMTTSFPVTFKSPPTIASMGFIIHLQHPTLTIYLQLDLSSFSNIIFLLNSFCSLKPLLSHDPSDLSFLHPLSSLNFMVHIFNNIHQTHKTPTLNEPQSAFFCIKWCWSKLRNSMSDTTKKFTFNDLR